MVHSADGHRPERAETVGRRRTCTPPRSLLTLPNAQFHDRAGGAAGAGGGVLRALPAPRDDETAAQSGTAPRVTGTRSAVVGGPSPRPPPRHPPDASVIRSRI